jgi:hypothetical protein
MTRFVTATFWAQTLLCVPCALAQTSMLKGVVTDPSGAVVPAATVIVRCAGQAERSTAADGTGAYAIAGLVPASCEVAATAPGLGLPTPPHVALKAGTQTVNLELTVQALREEVSVKAQTGPSVSVDASANASGLVIEGDALESLSDDPNDLQADLQALAGPSAGPNGGSIFIDGFSGGEIPPKASIREVRVNQDPFSSEYDKLGYGRIEIFTKPGADRYRGTVDYNFANDFWNSRNPYAPRKAPLLLDEFEGGGGGPLGKRASFTLDAQRNMVDNGYVVNAVNVDPTRFVLIQPYSEVYRTPQRFTRATPRVDYRLGENDTLTVRYGFTHGDINGAGIGAFDLSSRGYRSRYTHQTVQAGETAVRGTIVNEVRFQYYRSLLMFDAMTAGPAIQVLGSVNAGASTYGATRDTQSSCEFQNVTSIVHRAHMWKLGSRLRWQTDDSVSPNNFNGTFTFSSDGTVSSIERYRRTLLYQSLGYPAAQIRALGGGATQYTVNAGTPELTVRQFDAGLFFSDNWRLRPNLTLNYGLRYEAQTNMHDWSDVAPRFSVAWAPGARTGKTRARTVLRAGAGLFYDRFALANTLTALRYDGVSQQQLIIASPDFFPAVPKVIVSGLPATQSIERVAGDLRAPYILQSAFTLERQLSASTTMAVTYTNSHGLHLLRSRDVNAPLPGTYNPATPGSGVFPAGTGGPVFLMESSGIYNQNQAIANLTTKLNQSVSVFGFYVLNRAMSDTDGVGTTPANPYSYVGEYGSAATDVRHRVTVGGSLNARWNIRLSPFIIVQSGAPFNILSGGDRYGTTMFNARPALTTDSSRPGVIATPYGLLEPNPALDTPSLNRNFGRGPGQMTVNLRFAKTIGFGEKREGESKSDGAPSAAQRQSAAIDGRGLRSVIGTPSAPRRYNLVVSLSARNILNHNNQGPIIGNITSPLFGQSNQVAAGPNGEGFSENASNRRLELQIRLMF